MLNRDEDHTRASVYMNIFLLACDLVRDGDKTAEFTVDMMDKDLSKNSDSVSLKCMNQVMILAAKSILKDRSTRK